jgi:hypothetical protein
MYGASFVALVCAAGNNDCLDRAVWLVCIQVVRSVRKEGVVRTSDAGRCVRCRSQDVDMWDLAIDDLLLLSIVCIVCSDIRAGMR